MSAPTSTERDRGRWLWLAALEIAIGAAFLGLLVYAWPILPWFGRALPGFTIIALAWCVSDCLREYNAEAGTPTRQETGA